MRGRMVQSNVKKCFTCDVMWYYESTSSSGHRSRQIENNDDDVCGWELGWLMILPANQLTPDTRLNLTCIVRINTTEKKEKKIRLLLCSTA
jgi:hypothetical protein